MKYFSYLGLAICQIAFGASLWAAGNYQKTGIITLGGVGGWDYLTVDSQAGRLYVSHTTEVDVVNLKTQKVVGKVLGLMRVHGIAIADDLNTGFISDGGANEVVSFDLKTLAIKNKVKAGTNPDGVVYDQFSKRVFAFNGRSGDTTVIDAAQGKVAATVALGGKPEFPVSDGKGSIYDNIEDKNEIVRIDSKQLSVTAHWPIAPCASPSGLAIDRSRRRLFSVCHNKLMAVVDADSGKVIATPAIGEGPDAAAYDPLTKEAFSSNGDGTLAVIQQQDKNRYSVLESVTTVEGARTMALDPRTHQIYLACAEYGAAPAPSGENPRPRKPILPDTFKILVVSRNKPK